VHDGIIAAGFFGKWAISIGKPIDMREKNEYDEYRPVAEILRRRNRAIAERSIS